MVCQLLVLLDLKIGLMINTVDILAFGAHPDDVEFGCFGTLKKHIESFQKTY